MATKSNRWTDNKMVDWNAAPAHKAVTEWNPSDQPSSGVFKAQSDYDLYPSVPDRQGPPTTMDRDYIPGFLLSNIGRNVRAEFIIGSNQYVDKTGRIVEVGANYFVLEDPFTRTQTMADLYSVKFITLAPEGTALE